jgi:uncharacterized membrane protein
MKASQPFEHRLGHWVHYSLLAGLTLSGLLLMAGLIAEWLSPQPAVTPHESSLASSLAQALGGDPAALTNLGILALMATPIIRVLVLAAGWTMDRDWRFAAVAITVLTLLGISLSMGLG